MFPEFLQYSLIKTAKSKKLEPYASLRYIIDKLPTTSSLEGNEALLPRNITPEQMQCQRMVESP